MANGLEAGDTVKGTDSFEFFRGERSAQSPGRRWVRFQALVDYLNDPNVLTAFA